MATNKVKTKQLNIEQQNAIDLLVQGKSDREVAEAVGVGRPTVWEWRNHRSEFIVEMERRRRDIWGNQVDRLRQLVSKAVDVLAEDLQVKDDLKLRQAAAVHILRSVGLYGADLKPEDRSKSDIELDNLLKGL